MSTEPKWKPIEQAPKDKVILVNDTVSESPWAAAKWLEGEHWSGWVYDDDLMQESYPAGPEPTAFYELPPMNYSNLCYAKDGVSQEELIPVLASS